MVLPEFHFDSRELWLPVGVEESVKEFGFKWAPDLGLFVDESDAAVNPLNFPNDMQPLRLPPVVYHRAMPDPLGFWWQQFAMWYLYNPWNVAGFGPHEGDWEGLNLASLDEAGDLPILLCYSQHGKAGKREYWTHCPEEGQRPVVYVALGSHANYFQPGRIKTDVCDDAGGSIDNYEVRPFGSWNQWAGNWGNSGNSPHTPGRQRFWTKPGIAYSESEAQ